MSLISINICKFLCKYMTFKGKTSALYNNYIHFLERFLKTYNYEIKERAYNSHT